MPFGSFGVVSSWQVPPRSQIAKTAESALRGQPLEKKVANGLGEGEGERSANKINQPRHLSSRICHLEG